MKAKISYKNQKGDYKLVTKEFKDERHLTNYLNLISKTNKIVSYAKIQN